MRNSGSERRPRCSAPHQRWILVLFVLFTASFARAQVLISLLFGDNLNTGTIEFGLEGGATFSTISGLSGAQYKSGLNLGFYFDFKTGSKWKIATGVMVKSPWGTQGLAPYPTGDAALDSIFIGGSVERRLNYFNVPIMAKREFGHFFAMAGPQLSLGYKAADVFTKDVKDEDDLSYRLENRALYRAIDAGVVVGVGYRIMKGYGMNVLVRYYQGLTDIRKDPMGDAEYHSGFHLLLGIPIGVGKAQERMRQKAQEQQGQ